MSTVEGSSPSWQCRMGKPKPLNVTDPDAFMAIVLNPDTKQRVDGLRTLDDVVICEALRCALVEGPDVWAHITGLYDGLFMLAEAETRMQIYQRLAALVRETDGANAAAIIPFMLLDTDIAIVSSATIDYASLGALIDDDPMTRPLDIVGMINHDMPRNSPAVIGGLLAMGDPRVCELIRPLCDSLDDEGVVTVSKCWSGLAAKCMVEFYLDWLDRLMDSGDDSSSRFGNVAAGLTRLTGSWRFADGLRPFPYDEDSPDFFELDRDEFAASIAERLYAVERRESPPRVTSLAVEQFGLAPRMPPEDMAAISWPGRARNWLSRRMPWRRDG
jgi:hypothetical protein